ncbi:MAG TPA: hypothetical protein VFB42_06855 [Gaiellaceae bacterium]|nr:hypothetical protein [Gaiellaceae bacterium]
MLAKRGEQDDPSVWRVSVWGDPERRVFEISRDDAVERRPRGGAIRPARATAAKERRLPLVFSTGKAREQAAELLPGRVLENAVHEALAAGALSHDPGQGIAAVRLAQDDAVALVTRSVSPTSGRKSFVVVGVKKAA